MDSYMKEFSEVKAKNSSEEALQRWRKACWLVKNHKRRFRFTANLSKRSEVRQIQKSNQEKLRVAVLVSQAAISFIQGISYTVPQAVKGAGFEICADELGTIVEGHNVKKLKVHGGVEGVADKLSTSLTKGISISALSHSTTMEQPPPYKTYKLTAAAITYTKSTTTAIFKPCTPTRILKDISLTAHPSQILALVGPSGAGKSTLLDILSARTSPTSGHLLLNSSPLNPSVFRKLSAYVPQHDACLPLLTVAETFAFSASLLNPKTSDVPAIVSSLLDELLLRHLADTRLADGLSGGERRRVSIGLSLLHDPGVLLLDEPTSGLDSGSALSVMQTLRSIADSRHRTVILSIHQPSFKILSNIDRILLLSRGSIVHHGTLPSLQEFLLSNGFTVPPQINALEYAMEILSQLQLQQPADSPQQPLVIVNVKPGDDDVRYRSSRLHEIMTLYARFWKMIYRTKQLLLTNTLQALGVGLVLGTMYINIGLDKAGIEKRMGLFAFTLTFLLSSTTETLPIFISERPIILRETSSGVYRLSSYLMANTLVFLPYLLAIAVLYSGSVYFLVGLCSTWQAVSYFVLVVWVTLLMANSFVLFLSSVAPNFIAGTSLVNVMLAGFFLFSGYFISRDSLPKFWLFMHYLSMYKYALDALLINEYSCLVTRCFIWFDEKKKTKTGCMVSGGDVLVKRGLHERQRWINVYILIAFFLLYRLLCFLVLIRRVSRAKT